MANDDLYFLDATELTRLIRKKEVSAADVMRAHIAQIDAVNPHVNAIVTLVADRALAEAVRADADYAHHEAVGPLHGLPVAHKDLHDTKGIRTTRGSPIFADNVPAVDALPVARIKAAGGITIGKTNTPEFGLGSQTFNTVFGATHNPYDLSKTCGGSSGGAAVALACGMIPLADGSDTGGSLRNPAGWCNVVGLRCSPGVVPNDTGSWSALNTAGPMARTTQDLALLLSVLAGPDARSPLSWPESGDHFRRPLETDVRGLRIAWGVDACGLPMEPRVRAAVNATRRTFEDLGCETEDAWPNLEGANEVFQVLRAIGLASGPLGTLLAEHRAQIKETAIWNVERGLALTGEEVVNAERARGQIFLRMVAFMEQYDALVLPVSQVAPFAIEQEYVTEIDGVQMETYIDWMKTCSFITTTAHPAISVPGGFTAEGLPVGVQIVGRYHAEFALLQLAHAFEQATKYGQRRPDIALR